MEKTNESFQKLYNVIKKLRSPEGCNWDKEQTPESLRSSLLEETYECIEAIDEKETGHIKEELGDLYLLVTMIAYMHEEQSKFSVSDSLEDITAKLIRRHPHVFGNSKAISSSEILEQWDKIKVEQEGRKEKNSVLDKVSKALPPLQKAYELQKKAAKVGFDWQHVDDIWEKVHEEIDEVKAAVDISKEELESEIGDLIFAVINISRGYDIDPAMALQRTNNKFTNRFHYIEKQMKTNNKTMNSSNFELMDSYWDEAKLK